MNYSSELIPGVNGGYYPLQVRTLLSTGNLGFSDLPLYFVICAIIVKVLSLLFFNIEINTLIIHVSKIVDSFSLPVLLVPLFLVVKRTIPAKLPFYQELILASAAILSFSPLVLTSDLQKNSLAIPFIFFFLYFFILYIQNQSKKRLLLSIMFLAIIGLTHFGTFIISLAVFISGMLLLHKRKSIIPISIAIISSTLLLLFFDNNRALRLLTFWNVIFENPAILQGPLPPPDFMNYLFSYFLIGMSIYYLIKYKTKLSVPVIKLLQVFVLCLAIFSFPLLDIEYSRRLSLILFVPQTLIAFILYSFAYKRLSNFLSGLIAVFVFASMVFVVGNMKQPVISTAAFNDLKKLENHIPEPDDTIIIARHGLEWWTAWALKTKVAQDKSIDENMFTKYKHIIVLEQIDGINQLVPQGQDNPFHEPLPPVKNKVIYTSQYFNAYLWFH